MEDKFYTHDEAVHNSRAPKEVVAIIIDLIQPKSVLDVGCGIGTWLQTFNQLGIMDYLGVDGDYVDRSLLKIPEDRFQPQDLRTQWDLNRKFDIVISLEVAEHLEEKYAQHFVNNLVKNGDVIIFSAAVPGQAGQHHLNEQWLSYWIKIFSKFQFNYYDVLRPKIWNNPGVDVWYKQNIVIFCKNGHPLNETLAKISSDYVNLIHPDLFQFYIKRAERISLYEEGKLGVRLAFNALRKALANKLL